MHFKNEQRQNPKEGSEYETERRRSKRKTNVKKGRNSIKSN
jgi:hypothetical protein